MMSEIVVYDPNDQNPGGAELCAAVAELGVSVRWLLPEGASTISLAGPGVDPWAVLAGPRPWTLQRIRRRLLGPFALVWPVLCGRLGIVIWVHDAWDGILIALLSAIVPRRIYFIHNNPRAVRPRRGIAAGLERFLVHRCHVIVHSEWLREVTLNEKPHHVHVVAHPNYTLTAASAPILEPVSARVAYVGSLRPDKGAGILVDALMASDGGFEFRTIGQGELAQDDVVKLAQKDIFYVATGRVNQEDFLQELTHVQVVVAPYLQPTESGSVLLCMALGLPVLALDSPTMRRILDHRSLFSTPHTLGVGIAKFLEAPWPTFRLTQVEQKENCKADLEVALECRTPFR